MDKIENVKISELENPRFVRPKEVTFVQNGVSRRWEMVNIHNAVFGMAFLRNSNFIKLLFRMIFFKTTIFNEPKEF